MSILLQWKTSKMQAVIIRSIHSSIQKKSTIRNAWIFFLIYAERDMVKLKYISIIGMIPRRDSAISSPDSEIY